MEPLQVVPAFDPQALLRLHDREVRAMADMANATDAELLLWNQAKAASVDDLRQVLVDWRDYDQDLVLLPQLLDATADGRRGGAGAAVGASCTYEAAATALTAIGHQPARRSLWVVRGGDSHPYTRRGFTGLPNALGALVISRTVARDSPAAHRRASRERLALLPPRVCARVDHHGAPEGLLRAFERYLNMPQARTVIAGTESVRSEEDDAQRP